MSVQRVVATLPASGQYSLATRSNFLLFVSATAAINLRLESGGSAERFDGITGGLLVRRLKPWNETRVLGAAGSVVEALIGDEIVDQDETDIRLQIATIAGIAAVSVQPSTTFVTNPLGQFAIAGGAFVDIPANPLRTRITIDNDPLSTGAIWIRDQIATTPGGVQLHAGMSAVCNTRAALRLLNLSGGPCNVSSNEES